jgi:hypothetical protein
VKPKKPDVRGATNNTALKLVPEYAWVIVGVLPVTMGFCGSVLSTVIEASPDEMDSTPEFPTVGVMDGPVMEIPVPWDSVPTPVFVMRTLFPNWVV